MLPNQLGAPATSENTRHRRIGPSLALRAGFEIATFPGIRIFREFILAKGRLREILAKF